MKSILANSAGILLMIAGSAFAESGAGNDENGWLWILFLGFGAVIIVFQFVPSMILFGSMLKGLFGASAKENAKSSDTSATRSS